MLNKNRMMVFKNKGKDQEVSESSLPPLEEVIEFLARWKFFAGASRRSRIRRSAWCHSPSPSPLPSKLVRACVYTRTALPSSRFLSIPFPSAPLSLVSFYPFASVLFFSFRLPYFSHYATLSLFFPSFSFPLNFFSSWSISCLLSCFTCCFYNLLGRLPLHNYIEIAV